MSQLHANVRSNFTDTFLPKDHPHTHTADSDAGHGTDQNTAPSSTTPPQIAGPTIHSHPLTWSRSSLHTLLSSTGYARTGFDIVLNCDCVYEPLYGRSWEALVEVVDECLAVNPRCVVVTSVERRPGDGIGEFLERMAEGGNVGCVERVMADEGRDLELYLTTGVY